MTEENSNDNDKLYIRALINRAQEFAGHETNEDEPVQEKKPKAKRQYSDETKAKMVDRLRVAREKSLETRKLKAGIRDGIKQETKENEKSKLMELSAKYTKSATSAPPAQPASKPQPVQIKEPVKVEVKQAPAPAPVSAIKPKYFMPTMAHAKKWNLF
jgi:hypothetical protein